jgi:Phosphotransferase enzyme family
MPDGFPGGPSRAVLKDEPGREVVRLGDRVYRPGGWWTPAVHALLRHLEATGFRYAPRVLGTDDRGREVLSYIPGESGRLGWAAVVPEAGLARFARLLREYHDAVRPFVPPPEALWAFGEGAPSPGEVICHGDFGPWNVVYREGRPVGILDWDFAGPGPALDDVAYALEYVTPFRDDATAMRWLAYDRPPDRRRRLEVFATAYGLEGARDQDLVGRVVRRQRLDIARIRALAGRGLEPQATWVASGVLEELEARAVWSERHRALFERPAW